MRIVEDKATGSGLSVITENALDGKRLVDFIVEGYRECNYSDNPNVENEIYSSNPLGFAVDGEKAVSYTVPDGYWGGSLSCSIGGKAAIFMPYARLLPVDMQSLDWQVHAPGDGSPFYWAKVSQARLGAIEAATYGNPGGAVDVPSDGLSQNALLETAGEWFRYRENTWASVENGSRGNYLFCNVTEGNFYLPDFLQWLDERQPKLYEKLWVPEDGIIHVAGAEPPIVNNGSVLETLDRYQGDGYIGGAWLDCTWITGQYYTDTGFSMRWAMNDWGTAYEENAINEANVERILSLEWHEEVTGERYLDFNSLDEVPQGANVLLRSGADGKLREYTVLSVEAKRNGDTHIYSHRCIWSLQMHASSITCEKMPGTGGKLVDNEAAFAAATEQWNNMNWEAPEVGDGLVTVYASASMWRMSCWEALGVLIDTWGGEIDTSYEWVEVQSSSTEGRAWLMRTMRYQGHIGSSTPTFWYETGVQGVSVSRKFADKPQASRVVPLGAGLETDEGGYTRKIDIKAANGGVEYLEDEQSEVFEDWSVWYPTVYIENGEMETAEELKTWAQSVLHDYTRPKAVYTIEGAVQYFQQEGAYLPQLGDEGIVCDREAGWKLQSRILAIDVDEVAKTIKATCSNGELAQGTLAKLVDGVGSNASRNLPLDAIRVATMEDRLIAQFGTDLPVTLQSDNNLSIKAGSAQWTFGTNKAITQERTATGNVLVVKQTDIDFTTTSAATSLSTSRGTTFARVEDSTGAWLGGSELYLETNGTVSSRLFARRGNQQTGTLVSNYLQCRVDVNGNQVYAVSNPANFRSAIGITETTVTAISSILTAASGVTINSARLNRQGNFVHLYIQVKRNAATAANAQFTVGTLVSGYRPKGLAVFGSSSWSGQVGTSGNIAIRNSTGASVAANTNIDIGGVWSLA